MELGCGSGAFCRALTKAGYRMTGADVSAPMLTKAEELARKEGLKITYLMADAATFRGCGRFDFILSPNDCYNYIPPARLPAAFRRAADALKKNGIFWFDFSSEYKLREKVANNVFVDDRDDVTYFSFNALKGDRVETEATLFVRNKESYRRFDERHTQYIHKEEDVLTALSERFEVLSAEGHLGGAPEGAERVNFICRRK